MSIPPLVCSTPPPPEQCEDDKDHEDFDISYNLSQDDDEDCSDYNYGNYSSYSIYQSKSEVRESMGKEKWNSNLSDVLLNKNEDKNKSSNQLNCDNFTSNNNLEIESRTKFEESGVEDLNLIVNNDIVHSNDVGLKEDDSEVLSNDECQENNTAIQDEGGTNIFMKDENSVLNVSVSNNIHIPNENLDIKNEDILMESPVEETTNQVHEMSLENDLPHKTKETEENAFQHQEIGTLVTESPEISINIAVNEIENETGTDDDFGDFEDFQFSSSENCQVLTISTENPWENNCNKDDEFCTFTANFDLNRPKSLDKIDDAILCEGKQNKMNMFENTDDDFGNFDDFRSSENKETMLHTKEAISNPDVPVWNLHSSDNDLHVEDSINTVLTSIFAQEIPDSENELLGKLESFLSVTWGHLIDIDVRQPYMINWNNSLGQKTLLKALSIDSRNILFGPKWSYNTPKYAVNLNTAPLQPQKQFVSHNLGTELAEKVPNKEIGTWVDPFTTDGQEYTYAEALLLDLEHLMATLDQMAHKHSTLKISELLACHTENENTGPETVKRPIEIDAVESKSSKKSNNIYSSTINVQPLRHINLPDTHIFTPTDSETPRSKTIHYDTALAPIEVQENNKRQPGNLSTQLSNDENEYWDFQDFKGSNVTTSPIHTVSHPAERTDVNVTNEKVGLGGVSYQTQILQPIKLEPVIPTLNWPDPGEVKETFDDFSDFISSNSWTDDKGSKGVVESSLDIQHNNQPLQNFKEHESTTENAEDDFEIFQSALPSASAMDQSINSKTRSQMVISENVTIKNVDICDNSSVKIEFKNIKQHNNVNVLGQNASTSSNISNMQQDFTQPQTILGIKNHSDMLQPASTSSSGLSRQLHKSDQILQPLSLESYSQINWPNPGIDLQDLSRFNPINSLHSLKSDTSNSGNSKSASPAHNSVSSGSNQADDDIWGDFVSSVPKQQQQTPKKAPTFADDDEWTDFVSSPSIKPQNGLNTISFNVHTNLSMQKPCQNKFGPTNNQIQIDIPTLNYITPKSNNRGVYSEKHFQNL